MMLTRVPVQQLGSELIVNGNFYTDTAWTKVNATISGGKGNLDGDGQTALLFQNVLTENNLYRLELTVSAYNEVGQFRVINNSGTSYYTITTNGTFTVDFTHTDVSGNFIFRASSGAIGSVDNVSVKEIL